jgi:hypothetical protein
MTHVNTHTLSTIRDLVSNLRDINQTTQALSLLMADTHRAKALMASPDVGVSEWHQFVNDIRALEKFQETLQVNVDNRKLSDADFRQFVANCLKD